MKKIFFVAFIITLGFISCKKEEVAPTPIPTPVTLASDFAPMTNGSYWIYEQFRKNAGESDFKATGKLDSVYVKGDTTFLGFPCKTIVSPYFKEKVNFCKRFDGDKLYSNNGVVFSTNNFSTPLTESVSYLDPTTKKDTNQVVKLTMKKETATDVPFGKFDTYVAEVYDFRGKNSNSQKITWTNNYGTRYYAKGIGIIKEVVGSEDYSMPNPPYIIERRLVRYKIK